MNDLCVVGLGYVGLPTAVLFARAGLNVAGADVNTRIVDSVNGGRSPIEEPGLAEAIAEVTSAGRLVAATSPAPADAFIIAVGTPVDAEHKPHLGYVESAAEAVAGVLRRGNLVVLESTVPPGTTSSLVKNTIERVSGLVAGRDFALVHCAERAIPGVALKEMVENDRLVGGIDEASAKRAASLYATMVKGQVFETDVLTSEIVKLAENTYRDVNIAFANELARLCENVGADVWRVVQFANKHPRVHLHSPGPGVGGHCIPVVPWFLAAAAPDAADLIRLSRSINSGQADRVADRVLELLTDVSAPGRVAVLGVAYKAGIDDARESPALPIIEKLEAAGVEVRISDPFVKRYPKPLVSLEEALRGADVVLVLTDEREYAALDPGEVASLVRTRTVYDTRRAIDARAWASAGFTVAILGRGDAL